MIRDIGGTIFITVDAFCARYNFARRGQRFTYATGDLAQVAEIDADAHALRALVLEMEKAGKLHLEIRERPDLATHDSATAFEYLATKLVTAAHATSRRTDVSAEALAKADERTPGGSLCIVQP